MEAKVRILPHPSTETSIRDSYFLAKLEGTLYGSRLDAFLCRGSLGTRQVDLKTIALPMDKLESYSLYLRKHHVSHECLTRGISFVGKPFEEKAPGKSKRRISKTPRPRLIVKSPKEGEMDFNKVTIQNHPTRFDHVLAIASRAYLETSKEVRISFHAEGEQEGHGNYVERAVPKARARVYVTSLRDLGVLVDTNATTVMALEPAKPEPFVRPSQGLKGCLVSNNPEPGPKEARKARKEARKARVIHDHDVSLEPRRGPVTDFERGAIAWLKNEDKREQRESGGKAYSYEVVWCWAATQDLTEKQWEMVRIVAKKGGFGA